MRPGYENQVNLLGKFGTMAGFYQLKDNLKVKFINNYPLTRGRRKTCLVI